MAVQPAKCVAYSPRAGDNNTIRATSPGGTTDEIRIDNRGIVCVGVPVGNNEFRQGFLDEIARPDARKTLEAIKSIEYLQTRRHLLRVCLANKHTHLLRSIAPALTMPMALELKQLLQDEALHAWLLVWPVGLCCDWSSGAIDNIRELGDVRNLGTLAMYLVLVCTQFCFDALLSWYTCTDSTGSLWSFWAFRIARACGTFDHIGADGRAVPACKRPVS